VKHFLVRWIFIETGYNEKRCLIPYCIRNFVTRINIYIQRYEYVFKVREVPSLAWQFLLQILLCSMQMQAQSIWLITYGTRQTNSYYTSILWAVLRSFISQVQTNNSLHFVIFSLPEGENHHTGPPVQIHPSYILPAQSFSHVAPSWR
jgi:hypothetical protein